MNMSELSKPYFLQFPKFSNNPNIEKTDFPCFTAYAQKNRGACTPRLKF